MKGVRNGSPADGMRSRAIALISIGAAPFVLAACSLINNLDDYTGGTKDAGHDAASSESAADSTVASDTGTIDQDTNVDEADALDDSGDDTNVVDQDTGTVAQDSGGAGDSTGTDSILLDSGGFDGDAPVSPLALFGFSEITPRAVAGNGDFHEWVELTNYDVVTLDVSGVKVTLTTGSGPHSVTFPAGTTVAPGDGVAIGDDDTGLKADVAASGYKVGFIFSFAVPGGNIFSNSSALTFDVFAPGAATPYEHAVFPSRSWAAGHSFGYPVPTSSCPATGRFNAAGAPSAAWQDTPLDPADVYANVPDAGPLYGFPTTPNTGIVCP